METEPAALWRDDELVRSPAAGLFELAYRLCGAPRHFSVAAALLRVLKRFEGDFVRSRTARRLMSRWHGVEIGSYSYGACFDPRLCRRGVRVGRYVSVGPNVRFLTANHPTDALSTHPFFYETHLGIVSRSQVTAGTLTIGHDVWLGANAVVTPGCRSIGIGAVVGAGAVVTRDVAPFAIVAGSPASLVRYRFPEDTRGRILASRWWELRIEELAPLGDRLADRDVAAVLDELRARAIAAPSEDHGAERAAQTEPSGAGKSRIQPSAT